MTWAFLRVLCGAGQDSKWDDFLQFKIEIYSKRKYMLNKSVVNYQDQDISEKHIENEDFRFSNFDNAIIRNAYFSGCDFRDASFKHADLSHSKFHNCFLDGADFSGAMMRKMLINRCILAEANL
ncbi:MAG: hypothetical protein GWN01_01030, partial [Nitrosopumilaceae archaeon]|nr:pentapeptide repeat-containing protein [Nitrosopumilaceae archaeon]NIU85940.1 hypothetical protein [Nitrosopumilaceae archaeon]NIV64765.1 hypothetical protein [Nitrosopumilaceae archaeon]NIX60163.1 hypothetical protein [Nitrosopumilaceae archaeon]